MQVQLCMRCNMLQDITGEQGEYLLTLHDILHSRGYSVSDTFTFNILRSDDLDMFIVVMWQIINIFKSLR